MGYIVPAADAVVVAIAVATMLVLRDVASLAPSPELRRAWWTLSGMLGACIALLFVHAACNAAREPGVGDLVGVGIFLVGACFICAVTWLSRRTARDMLRIEGVARTAYRDALTGIGNRRQFGASLEEAVAEAARSGLPLSVVALDIDHFKAVNDTHGHAVGDAVLQQVARTLADGVRPLDTPCRVGGEEFAVIVPRLEPPFVALRAEQLRMAFAGLRVATGGADDLRVTVSLGLATLAAGEDGSGLLRRADAALYAAKRDGRDRLRLAV